MAAPDKITVRHGLLAKLEGSYDEGHSTTSPAAGSDAIQPERQFDIPELEHAFSGERNIEAGAGGPLERVAASGRFAEGIVLPVAFRGPGSAYTAASDLELDPILQACGHTATVDTTSGSETVTYSPTTELSNLASIAASFYARGQLWKATAGLGSLSWTITDEGFLVTEPEFSFRFGDPVTDATVPSMTFQSTIPPKATNLSVSIGNFTSGRIRSIEFSQNREIGGRRDMSVGGHSGFAPGQMDPRLTITLEADALAASSPWHTSSDFDPYRFFEDAESVSVSFTVGSTQYNKLSFSASQAQLVGNPSEDDDGPSAVWSLEFILANSAPLADDMYSITAE